MEKEILNTISPTAWRSAGDIAVATGNMLGREVPKPKVSALLKRLTQNGKVMEMKNNNRLFYRRVE